MPGYPVLIMNGSHNQEPVVHRTSLFFICVTLLLILSFVINPGLVQGDPGKHENQRERNEELRSLPESLLNPDSAVLISGERAKNLYAMAGTPEEGPARVRFTPKNKRINAGAEESVTLRRDDSGSDNVTVSLESNHPDNVSVPTESKSITFWGKSNSVSLKIRTVKEGSAEITPIVVRGPPPTEKWDTDKELDETAEWAVELDDVTLKSLEEKNGFRRDHAQRMNTFAQFKNVFLIVRDGNKDSVDHFRKKEYMPKPMACKAKTAKVGPHKGLVVNPTHEFQAAQWERELAKAVGKEKKRLEGARKKALDAWKKYSGEMTKKGYRVNDKGLVVYDEKLPDGSIKTWKGIHGDYDLHGIYRKSKDGTVHHVSAGSGQEGDTTGEVIRRQLNDWLTLGGKKFIQHGGQDDWIPDPKKVPFKPPDPPATVFFPDDREPLRLETAEEMMKFYINEMKVPWPYGKPDGLEPDTGIVTKAVSAETLSVKVIDLENELKKLLKKDDKKKLAEKVQKLQTDEEVDMPPDPVYEKGYDGLYLETAYKLASKALNKDKNQLPYEALAIPHSEKVIDDVTRKRDFSDIVHKKLSAINFTLDHASLVALINLLDGKILKIKDAPVKAGDLRTIKEVPEEDIAEFIINNYYEELEKEYIIQDFTEYASRVIRDFPELKERLISVQAFHDRIKKTGEASAIAATAAKVKKKTKVYVTGKAEGYIRERVEDITPRLLILSDKLLEAKQYVDAAYTFYQDPKEYLRILVISFAKDQCTTFWNNIDTYFIAAGTAQGGPIGALAGYGVSRAGAYIVCTVGIEALFSMEDAPEYSKDIEVDRYVKLFYTGDKVKYWAPLPHDDLAMSPGAYVADYASKMPHDINFFTRFGWNRDEILERTKNPTLLTKALKQHLINLWHKYPENTYPEVRRFLDIAGDNREIPWDDGTREKTDIEQFLKDPVSWFEGPERKKEYMPVIFTEFPRIARNKSVILHEALKNDASDIEVSLGDKISVMTRFAVLGFAGQDETINMHWAVTPSPWFTGIDKPRKVKIAFPEDDVEVEKLIHSRQESFSFNINQDSFIPGKPYLLTVKLRYNGNDLSVFDIPFTIKPEEKVEAEAKEEVEWVVWYAPNIGLMPFFVDTKEMFDTKQRMCDVKGGGKDCTVMVQKVLFTGPDPSMAVVMKQACDRLINFRKLGEIYGELKGYSMPVADYAGRTHNIEALDCDVTFATEETGETAHDGVLTTVEPGGVMEVDPGSVMDTTPRAVMDTSPGGIMDVDTGGVMDTSSGGVLETVTPGGVLESTEPGGVLDEDGANEILESDVISALGEVSEKRQEKESALGEGDDFVEPADVAGTGPFGVSAMKEIEKREEEKETAMAAMRKKRECNNRNGCRWDNRSDSCVCPEPPQDSESQPVSGSESVSAPQETEFPEETETPDEPKQQPPPKAKTQWVVWFAPKIGYKPIYVNTEEFFNAEQPMCSFSGGGTDCSIMIEKINAGPNPSKEEVVKQACDMLSDFGHLSGIYAGMPVATYGGKMHNIRNLGCGREYWK